MPITKRECWELAQELPADQYAAWVSMGQQFCERGGLPFFPCPKGPTADEPGFCKFYPCPCGKKKGGEA